MWGLHRDKTGTIGTLAPVLENEMEIKLKVKLLWGFTLRPLIS